MNITTLHYARHLRQAISRLARPSALALWDAGASNPLTPTTSRQSPSSPRTPGMLAGWKAGSRVDHLQAWQPRESLQIAISLSSPSSTWSFSIAPTQDSLASKPRKAARPGEPWSGKPIGGPLEMSIARVRDSLGRHFVSAPDNTNIDLFYCFGRVIDPRLHLERATR
jgi:hypothetical protein